MIYLAIIVGCILGAIFGMNAPIISYTYSTYLAIAVIAALDSVFGGISSVLKKTFDLKIFLSGFFVNNNIRTKVKCRYLLSNTICICK